MGSVPAGTKLGKYEVVKPLASGGMAELLLARTAPTARPLVLKWVRPEHAIDGAFIEAFVGEGKRAAQLRHPNIVEVHDVGRADGTHYLAMEYVHGDDARKLLARLHERRAKLPVQHILAITSAVAQALHHAHEQTGGDGAPVLHLAIKPANVIITADGAVKLADFGIARAALTEGRTDLLPAFVGYLSPEQCTGQPVDRRSDVFGLGIFMYELAVGRRLFKGDTDFATMAAIVAGDIPLPTKHRGDLPKELEAVIMKALSRAPEDRFQTAHDVHAALDKFASRAGVRGSLTTLAGYTKRLFGTRPEPWLVNDEGAESGPASIDFDGAPKGIATPPAEAAICQLPSFVVASADSPIVRLRKKVSREIPTEQLNLAALKAPTLPDKSAPVKIPAASTPSARTAKPTRSPAPVPAPAPVRTKPKTVQIPVIADKVVKEDTTEVATKPPRPEEATDILSSSEISVVDRDPVMTPTKPVERAQTPTVPRGPSFDTPVEDDTITDVQPEKHKNGANGAAKPLVSLASLAQLDARREQAKAKLPAPRKPEVAKPAQDEERASTEKEETTTAVANPPPMPVPVAVPRDLTEHVRPLPPPGQPITPNTETFAKRRRTTRWLALGALAVAAAATAIVIGLGGKSPDDPPPSAANAAAADDEQPETPTPDKAAPDEPPPPPEEELRTSSEPRTPRNSGVTTDDQPKPEEPKPDESEPDEPEEQIAAEPPPPPPVDPEPEPEPEPEPPPPPKFVEPKDPSPPDEEVAKKPSKPVKKPAAVARKPKPKPKKPKPVAAKSKPKPKKPPAKPAAGKWDKNALFPK